MVHADPPEWVTTSTVLKRLADFEDGDAWRTFDERFRAPIAAFARRQGLSTSDAEDVAQETLLGFAEGYRQGGYDRTRGRLSQWLFGIARRRMLQARRKVERHGEVLGADHGESSFFDQVPGDEGASALWDEVWERSLMEQCLRQVRREFQPATFRVFEMLVLEKREVQDAITELELTRNAVYVAKHRVMTRMRALLQEFEEVP